MEPVNTNQALTRSHRDIFDLAAGYLLILAALWTPLPWAALVLLIALGWIAFRTITSGVGLRQLGLSLGSMKRDYWLISLAALIALSAAFSAVRYDTMHAPFGSGPLELHAGAYLLWAFTQQFMLQAFFLSRLLRLLPRSAAVIVASGLFAAAHIPNPILVATTMVWGIIACTLFLRYRDLYTLAIVHAVLGLSLAFAIPAPLHHQMRVGLGYLRYRPTGVERSGIRVSPAGQPVE